MTQMQQIHPMNRHVRDVPLPPIPQINHPVSHMTAPSNLISGDPSANPLQASDKK
tara:strand:+ start:3837 stop:4001 length:165 start_codon:yes stop_codon:yes gene_type:complete